MYFVFDLRIFLVCLVYGVKDEVLTNIIAIDIDECVQHDMHSCDLTRSTCNNTASGYFCDCFRGFKSSREFDCIDIDECEDNGNRCDVHSTECNNRVGSYGCSCKPGYQKDLNNDYRCIDIDECKSVSHDCNLATSSCRNKNGGYSCDCRKGYEHKSLNDIDCLALNDCDSLDNECDPSSTICLRSSDDYLCECKYGFEKSPNITFCIDVDECSENVCDHDSTDCINSQGSFSCQCKSGFSRLEQSICSDIDECSLGTHACDKQSTTCKNIIGGYKCVCLDFHKHMNGSNTTCEEINQCVENLCDLKSTICRNNNGSYLCQCKVGFKTLNALACSDIDECLDLEKYDDDVTCINMEGGVEFSCPKGFRLAQNGGKYICRRGCDEAAIQNDQFGSIHFPEGGFNKTVNSTNTCLDSNKTKATATCLKDSTGLFYWKIQEFHCENRSTFSDIKKELAELRENITSDFNKSVEIVLKLAKDNVQNMTTDEIDTMVKFVQDASNVNTTISEEGAKSLVEILDEVMKSPSVVPNKTETPIAEPSIVKTQLGLIGTLEAVVSKIELTTEIFEKDCENFQVKVYEQRTPEDRNFPLNAVPPGSNDDEKSEFQINVAIPKEAFFIAQNKTGKLRANFIVYKSNELFENPSESQRETKIVSNVISGSIAGASISGLKTKINLTFQVENTTESSTCVYADLSSDSWKWSDHGMETIRESGQRKVVCQSDHLTNFAVLAGYKVVNESHSRALTYISIVGMVLSIICLSFLIFTQMFFKKFRKGQYQLALLNLSVALIMVNLLIILGLDRVENVVICSLVAALLHYFLLVSFAWMLIEAILQYYKFVKVFDVHVSSFVLKTTLPAWTLPALVVILTASIDYRQYSGFDHYCWLADQAFRYAFLLPLGLMVVANTFIFIRIIKGISCDRPKGMQTNQIKSRLVWLQVQAGICCFVVMGLTWCFALFAFGKAALVMHFLFAIFNSMQGCFIFILFCLREKPVRKAWYTLLCPSKMSKKLISGTDSQSSSSLGRFRNRIKKEKAELSISDFSAPPNTDSTDATLSKI